MITSYIQSAISKNCSQTEASIALLILFVSVYYIAGKNGLWMKRRKVQRQQELVNKFPGWGHFGFLGSAPELYQLFLEPCREFLIWVTAMSTKFGPIFRFWLLGKPKLIITCTDTAIKLLKNDSFPAKPSEIVRVAKISCGEGLLALTPDVHGPRKKMWLQWMNRKHIDGSLGRFTQEALKFCKALEQFEQTGEEFDIMEHAIYCTLSTVANSALGEEYMKKLPESTGKEYIHDVHTFSYNCTVREIQPWTFNDLVYFNLTKRGRETRKCISRGNIFTKQAIIERKLLRQNGLVKSKDDLPCFLDHLLDQKDQGLLTEEEIIQELNVFIVAGYDTTGLSICYTLYLLSLHPEYQTTCVEELVNIFGKDLNEEITPAQIRQMKYLEMCIKESLRLYPILPMTFRRSTHDVVLDDGRIIPEDVDVYVAIYLIHKDPKYFPEPEKFIPTRHTAPIPAFMPFSLGSRNCIGQVYAMQEMKIILAHLLMRYKWVTTEKSTIVPLYAPVLIPENGLHFKIEKRFENKV